MLIHGFKDYCALLFFKGVLMEDKQGILIQQKDHVQDRWQLRFTSLQEIECQKKLIKAYVKEAILIENGGLKVKFKTASDFSMPD